MITTKSPVSTCGAKVGLCLPRRRLAVWVARRPRTTSEASIMCHGRSISPGFGLYVRTELPCLVVGLGSRAGRVERERQAYPRETLAAVAQQQATIPGRAARGQNVAALVELARSEASKVGPPRICGTSILRVRGAPGPGIRSSCRQLLAGSKQTGRHVEIPHRQAFGHGQW